KVPPISGQSASTKQSTPWTGTSSSSRPHELDLLEHSVDEFGAVARTDKQSLKTRPEEATFDLEVRTPPVLLGIDDIDAAGGHGQVVDIRLASRDPPVMQQPERV